MRRKRGLAINAAEAERGPKRRGNRGSPAAPFDPLARDNIGTLLAIEFVTQPLHPLPPRERFIGAGVYALYYTGKNRSYRALARLNSRKTSYPVYVGRALRENAKQGFSATPGSKARIYDRLGNHARSISAGGLDISDFSCRFLVLEDAFISLAESVLISIFRPAWNGLGLGNNVVGEFRKRGKASLWDALHPGRPGRPRARARMKRRAQERLVAIWKALRTPPTEPIIRRMRQRVLRFA